MNDRDYLNYDGTRKKCRDCSKQECKDRVDDYNACWFFDEEKKVKKITIGVN